MKKWCIFKEYICCPILAFLFCFRALVGYYGKIFLLLANWIDFFFIFKNCFTKKSLPYLVRFLYFFSLYSVDFKETGVAEALFLAICSQKF